MTSIRIPRAIQFVLDDVGWREGWDISDSGGPFRAGVDRLLGPADYAAVADIGKALNIRPQCAMVLCEWDRENVCAQVPTATQAGVGWDNSRRVGDWAFESRDVFVQRAANIEFGMHGVGHEHWEDGERTRAEWMGPDAEHRWPWHVLQAHLDCFRNILDQYDLGPAAGMSLPPSFVPCAFRYYWDDADPESTGALMAGAGVRYASTPYSSCCFVGDPPAKLDGGFDHGLLVLDRGSSGVPWYAHATVPDVMPKTSICGIHWPNVLCEDPDRNGDAVALWVDYFHRVAAQPDLMLAANTTEAWSQWVYVNYADLRREDGQWVLDASGIPEAARPYAQCPIVKVDLPAGEHVSRVMSSDCRVVAYSEWGEGTVHRGQSPCAQYALVALKLDDSMVAHFDVEFGDGYLPLTVMRNGTYDALDLRETDAGLELHVRVYGQQQVALRVPFAPGAASFDTPRLSATLAAYDPSTQIAKVDVTGHDIHGDVGVLTVTHPGAFP